MVLASVDKFAQSPRSLIPWSEIRGLTGLPDGRAGTGPGVPCPPRSRDRGEKQSGLTRGFANGALTRVVSCSICSTTASPTTVPEDSTTTAPPNPRSNPSEVATLLRARGRGCRTGRFIAIGFRSAQPGDEHLLYRAVGRGARHVRRRSPDRHHRVVWPASPDELIALQDELADAAPPSWHPHGAQPSIAACGVCFARGQTRPGARSDRAWAAAALLHGRRVIAQANVEGQAGARYTPGLLALREGPCLEAAVRSLEVRPDVLLVDATGRDHPWHAGLALQLGAVLNVPTVGVTHRPLLADGAWPADIRGGPRRCCSTVCVSARGCEPEPARGHSPSTPPGEPMSMSRLESS